MFAAADTAANTAAAKAAILALKSTLSSIQYAAAMKEHAAAIKAFAVNKRIARVVRVSWLLPAFDARQHRWPD